MNCCVAPTLSCVGGFFWHCSVSPNPSQRGRAALGQRRSPGPALPALVDVRSPTAILSSRSFGNFYFREEGLRHSWRCAEEPSRTVGNALSAQNRRLVQNGDRAPRTAPGGGAGGTREGTREGTGPLLFLISQLGPASRTLRARHRRRWTTTATRCCCWSCRGRPGPVTIAALTAGSRVRRGAG